MNSYKVILVILLNLIISLGYYIDNLDANIQEISTDLGNIIPICKKLDNPNLFKNDLFLNDIRNVEYYTPFYVKSLRFIAKFNNYDYLQAINILGFIAHLVYGVLWFFLFYCIKKDFWIALLFSIFIRGVIWPPGGELLGISDVWSIMPRTIYQSLMPLPFLIFFSFKRSNLIFASFVLGFIFNFHPISGIGGIAIYFALYIVFLFFYEKLNVHKVIQKILIFFVFCLLGMLPFLITYFTKVNSDLFIDQELFNSAFRRRIPILFEDPLLFITYWNRPVTYLFGLCFVVYYFFDSSLNKIYFKALFYSVLLLLLSSNFSVYIEDILNSYLDKNIRMSFQLIRFQKFILLLFQISAFLLFVEISNILRLKSVFKFLICFIYIIVLSVSTSPFFNNVPFFSEDFTRLILPSNLTFSNDKTVDNSYAEMVSYIKNETENEDVFYGDFSYLIRAGAERSVVLDSKGASMLIEGNQSQFIKWYQDDLKIDTLKGDELIYFLKERKVDYFISLSPMDNLTLKKRINNVYLYKI
jgi:hypothetical protein